MPLTDNLVSVGEALESYLEDGKDQLGIRKVWYGADDLIPETPAITVAPEGKSRTLIETGHMTYNDFTVTITIYHARLGDPAVTRKECDRMAEEVEAYLHSNIKLGGLVYTSLVQTVEPGVARRANVILKATRLTWVGRSKTRI